MAALPAGAGAASPQRQPLNILFITADDLNCDSLGVFGCRTPDITPNIDRLAAEGMRFERAHVTVAICQPSRSVLMTGRYPHRNGAVGFNDIDLDVPTLIEKLREAGYFTGIFGKVYHLSPPAKFPWHSIVEAHQLGMGRDPDLYRQHAVSFFEQAKNSGQPFFLMANSEDPHRPFAGSQQESEVNQQSPGHYPKASRYYKPEEVTVPGFLPDTPEVRLEMSQYFTSVHRCDQTVGKLLDALRESGLEHNTLVMFLSDNGMATPFAKGGCYLAGTRTPWIVRWPGVTKTGSVDQRHFISGIDLMPTLLEAAGLGLGKGMDGRSFMPLLNGNSQQGRDQVFTVYYENSSGRDNATRCIQNARFGYIFNPWSDGHTVFKTGNYVAELINEMKESAKTNTEIADRLRFFQYRVPEELYDLQADPDGLNNLIHDSQHKRTLDLLRQSMLQMMIATSDPLLEGFRGRLAQIENHGLELKTNPQHADIR